MLKHRRLEGCCHRDPVSALGGGRAIPVLGADFQELCSSQPLAEVCSCRPVACKTQGCFSPPLPAAMAGEVGAAPSYLSRLGVPKPKPGWHGGAAGPGLARQLHESLCQLGWKLLQNSHLHPESALNECRKPKGSSSCYLEIGRLIVFCVRFSRALLSHILQLC